MVSRDKIWVNDVSSDTVNLYVDTTPFPNKAEQVTHDITIPGRDEKIIISDDYYEDIQVDISTYTFDNTFDMLKVYKWLEGAKTLRTSESNFFYYYRVKKVLGIIPNYLGHGRHNIIISFVCSPFKYKDTNTIVKTAKTFSVSNTGGYYCRPVYKLTGSGDITLTVNNDANRIKVFGVNGSCTIDAERMLVYDDSGNLLRTQGKIPFAVVGNNDVVITGNVSKSEITLNERWR